MSIDAARVVSDLYNILARRSAFSSPGIAELTELSCLYVGAVVRYAPPDSHYHDQMRAVYSPSTQSEVEMTEQVQRLEGIVRALLHDYDGGRLRNYRELVHADLFADFLAMAEYLLQEGFKDAAAVHAGGVLEQHIRKLCDKSSIPTTVTDTSGDARPKKLDAMNSELAKAQVYNKNEQKSVGAWAGTRNSAAHGHYNEYTTEQVRLMILGVRDFVNRHPA